MRRVRSLTFALGLVALFSVPLVAREAGTLVARGAGTIPQRPEALEFGPLRFDVPPGESFRHVLPSGIVAYVAEDHSLPLVNISLVLRGGGFLDPPDKLGLASLTAEMMRQGGTRDRDAEAFDERVEFLAAGISANADDYRSSANLNCITPVLDESLDLFFEMLRRPGFQPDRLEVAKANRLEDMKQRNDNAGQIHRREWGWLIYGEDHYATRSVTEGHLAAIGRQDLIDFHARYWRPENMILAITGDVDTAAILERLEAELGRFEGEGDAVPWPPPQPTHRPAPGVYHVEKDIPQGRVLIGHLTRQWNDWDDPDLPAIEVMNDILGSSGFTSRIMKRVRSDEGLAYSAGSRHSIDPFEPATFSVAYQSKSPTVALAAKLSLEEMRRIRDEPVTDEELRVAKASIIETFPRRFESKAQTVGTYAQDAFIDRPHTYWQSWRDRVRAVTADDVQRAARRYLRPEEVVVLVVGRWEEIAPGDADQRASMAQLFGSEVTHLPLRDPLTLEPSP